MKHNLISLDFRVKASMIKFKEDNILEGNYLFFFEQIIFFSSFNDLKVIKSVSYNFIIST